MDVQTSPSRVNQVAEGVGEFPEVDELNEILDSFLWNELCDTGHCSIPGDTDTAVAGNSRKSEVSLALR